MIIYNHYNHIYIYIYSIFILVPNEAKWDVSNICGNIIGGFPGQRWEWSPRVFKRKQEMSAQYHIVLWVRSRNRRHYQVEHPKIMLTPSLLKKRKRGLSNSGVKELSFLASTPKNIQQKRQSATIWLRARRIPFAVRNVKLCCFYWRIDLKVNPNTVSRYDFCIGSLQLWSSFVASIDQPNN